MKVRPYVVEMGGTNRNLRYLVGQVRGRMGYECMGEHHLRDVIDEFAGSFPRQFGCRVRGAKGLHDCLPEQHASG